MATTVTHAFLTLLKHYGVDKIFGIPGGGPTADLASIAGEMGMEFVLTQHETSAVIMAGTYGQRKGTVGVVVTAIGPGVANLANGAAHAYLDRLPVLMISDRYGSGVHEFALRQQFDHFAMMQPITKARIAMAESTWMPSLKRAISTALSGRPGPVFIDFPGNLAARPATLPEASAAIRHENTAVVSDAALKKAAARASKAERPIILAGMSALGAKAGVVGKLAAALKAPVLTSPKAKGVIAADSPWHAGVFMGGKLEDDLLKSSDLILLVGFDPVELLPKPWKLPTYGIAIDNVPDTEQVYSADIELVGDIGDAATRMAGLLKPKSKRTTKEVAEFRKYVTTSLAVKVKGLNPNDVITVTRDETPREAVLVSDVGANKLLTVELWDAYGPNEFLMSNGLATMGFCLPAAMGVKLAEPDRPVMCLCGDAGFMMRLPELLTGVRHKLPIVYVIFADDQHSLISSKQEMKKLSVNGIDFPRPNYAALAEGFGIKCTTVETPAALRKAVKQALKESTSTLIEARIDPSGYAKQFDIIREL